MKLDQWIRMSLVTIVIVATLSGAMLISSVRPAFAAPETANDYFVDRIDDDASASACTASANDCSLRGAITAANAHPGADNIYLTLGAVYTLSIPRAGVDDNSSGDLNVTSPLTVTTITGICAIQCTSMIKGNLGWSERLMTINSGVPALFNDVIFSGGNAGNGSGGGIYNQGTLTLNYSGVVNSQAAGGGGIYNTGTLTLIKSTLHNNSTGGYGGGLYNAGNTQLINSDVVSNTSALGGAGLYNYSGGLQLMNSTVSGNQTAGFGAGLSVFQGGIDLSNVTMAGNNANYDGNYFGSGGGISNSSGTITLHNTVLARNLVAGVASNGAADCDGTLTSLGYNLIGDNAGCTMTPASGDQIGTNASPIDPRLAPLQTDNFPTFVYPLLAGSPAVDAGDSANCPATDQHLRPRPVGPRCDIGAYEALFWQIYLPAIAK